MSSRATTRALRALAAGSKPTTRSLHMTGPATFSSLLTSERPAAAGVRASETPSQQGSKRPVLEAADSEKAVRHFNTSRSLKAVKDSSTIDFAYLPDFNPDAQITPFIRVPILPQTQSSTYNAAMADEIEEVVHMPTIHTVAADGTHIYAPSAMSEVTDNNTVDFQGMAAMVASRLGKTTDEGAGMAKQLWGGLLDDVFGSKGGPARA